MHANGHQRYRVSIPRGDTLHKPMLDLMLNLRTHPPKQERPLTFPFLEPVSMHVQPQLCQVRGIAKPRAVILRKLRKVVTDYSTSLQQTWRASVPSQWTCTRNSQRGEVGSADLVAVTMLWWYSQN